MNQVTLQSRYNSQQRRDDPAFSAAPPGKRPDRPLSPSQPIARLPMDGLRPMPVMSRGGGGGRR